MGVHGGSVECDDRDKKLCDVTVNAYKIDESDKYDTEDWKAKHKVKVYNRDDGDFTIIDKHITLRFETGATDGVGSKIFQGITLPDIQVCYCIISCEKNKKQTANIIQHLQVLSLPILFFCVS